MTNAEKFMAGAGDDYYERNRKDFGKYDPVPPLLEMFSIKPKSVFEIGCANGWRLAKLKDQFGCQVGGLDPSRKAIAEAMVSLGGDCSLVVGTADKLPLFHRPRDLVILGFVLWFCEPSTWFRIASEIDRIIEDGGFLIVHDYCTPRPQVWQGWQSDETSDLEREIIAYTHDFSKLWGGHPCYRKLAEHINFKTIGNLHIMESALLFRKSMDDFVPIGKPPEPRRTAALKE